MARQIFVIPTGESVTVTIGEGIRLTIKPGAGGSADYSEVNDSDADAHGAVVTNAAARTVLTPEWPYYHIEALLAACEVGVV